METYLLKQGREGFNILPGDELTKCPDGYTEVRRKGQVVAVYQTALLRRNG